MTELDNSTRVKFGQAPELNAEASISTTDVSPSSLKLARARLFVQPQLTFALAAHMFTLIGAIAISLAVYLTSTVSLEAVILWPAVIAASNSLTILLNIYNHNREIADDRLVWLASVKTLCNVFQGIAWGLGPMLLNVPGEAVTVIAPAWAMVTGVGVLVFAAAPWPWSSFSFIVALFLPALLFLLPHGGELERTIGIAMLVSFPFSLLIGRLGVNYVRDLVATRLSVSALLEREGRLTARLKQLNAERTRFFSAASHDLRQPLQALGFYATWLRTTTDTKDHGEVIARLKDCADQLDRQFNAILGVASTDEAIEAAKVRPVRLQLMLQRASNALEPEAHEKGLELRVVPTTAVADVPAAVLERVLVNLVSNAVRYTNTGRILIGVRRRGTRYEVIVGDTGIGIEPDNLERIFADFYQVRNPERHASKGFGLGLGVVKRLCEGMDWEIRVRSKANAGSTFSFFVPASSSKSAPNNDNILADWQPFDLSHLAAIVVEDDPLVADATTRLLNMWSVENLACRLEDEVLGALAKRDLRKRCVVLMDYRLGDGPSGLQIADRIVATYGNAVSLILVTGEQDDDVLTSAARRNFLLLRKPLKPIQLRAALMNLVRSEAQEFNRDLSRSHHV